MPYLKLSQYCAVEFMDSIQKLEIPIKQGCSFTKTLLIIKKSHAESVG